jgi:hypothetical protein
MVINYLQTGTNPPVILLTNFGKNLLNKGLLIPVLYIQYLYSMYCIIVVKCCGSQFGVEKYRYCKYQV